MRYLMLLAAAAIVSADRVEAASVYPWCAHYMMKGAPHSCGFVSFEQCLVSVRGIGGTCNRNPFHDEPPVAPRRKADARR